ncbi:LysR family transcriptional regulator [Advenella faeciporci]|uniref:LysR family transcriptional regulator n=1 Tax=Advenella faeciporci TaxID=797535 RepID=A0A918MW78_9BURK|nr:LysR family transcriptional regulator [Advenella faeciporci]GGW80358.1 LysR family transcriptional regulator [Advenella faeciporci]
MNPVRFDLHHLRAFKMVAEQLHFKKAAELLHITQPGLTRIIKALEEALQVELFERSTRQVKLTAAGYLFLQETEHVFMHLARAIELAQKAKFGDIGHLIIAYNDYAIQDVLPNTLDHFRRQYPSITTDLLYMPTQEQIQGLQQGSLDLGFGFAFSDDPEELGVQWKPVFQDDPVVLLQKDHPLAGRKVISLADLANERFVVGSKNHWQVWRRYFYSLCRHAGFHPIIAQEASTITGIMSLVAAHMGIAILSQSLRKYVHRDLVAIDLALSGQYPQSYISIMWQENNANPCVPLFIQNISAGLTMRPSLTY